MERNESLDGLRGFAALIVLLHHAAPRAGGFALLTSGYLAVDLFFMLSGFVVAGAYEHRFADGMSTAEFVATRLRRLYPTIAFAAVCGALVTAAMQNPGPMLALSLIIQLLFYPVLSGPRGIYPLNGVQWSLFFELIANAIHRLVLWRCSTRNLTFLVGFTLVWLFFSAQRYECFGVGDIGNNFMGGFPRVCFSYCVGLLIFRLKDSHRLTFPRIWAPLPPLILMTVLLLAEVLKTQYVAWQVDFCVVAATLPVIFLLSAFARIGQRLSSINRSCGWLSYPLYAIHLPAIAVAHKIVPHGGYSGLFFAVAVSLGAALSLAHVIEPRAQRQGQLGDRFSMAGIPTPVRISADR